MEHGIRFDSNRNSILGIKIYHLVWLDIVFYLFLSESAWFVTTSANSLMKYLGSSISLTFLISMPPIFISAVFISVLIFGYGFLGMVTAYKKLAGIEASNGTKDVLAHAILIPIVASIGQFVIVWLVGQSGN